jgi:hypothetical protein
VDDLNASRNFLKGCNVLNVRHIDIVVTTHYDRDHIGGLNVLLGETTVQNKILRGLFRKTVFFDRGEPRPHSQTRSTFEDMPKSPTNYGNYVSRLYPISKSLPSSEAYRQTELMRGHPKVGESILLKNTHFTKQQNAGNFPRSFQFFEPTEILRSDILNWNLLEEEKFEAELHVVVANRTRIGAKGKNHQIIGMKNEENNNSVCLLLKMGNFSYWFPGELEEKGEAQCVDALAALNVTRLSGMKLAHHGSHYSTSPQFMQQLQPQIAVISCGPNNTYNHPSEAVLNFLENEDYIKHVFLTGYGGDPEDPRNPKNRSPFSPDQKFQFAGSEDDNQPGRVSIFTTSDHAALPDPQFLVSYYAQTLGFYSKVKAKFQAQFPDDWNYLHAYEVLDYDENSQLDNFEFNPKTGIITVYDHAGSGKIAIGTLHPEGDWINMTYPNGY